MEQRLTQQPYIPGVTTHNYNVRLSNKRNKVVWGKILRMMMQNDNNEIDL
jgi:hypothetical protein